MSYSKVFTISALFVLFFAQDAGAQNLPSCEIPVKTEIVHSTNGLPNGEIKLDFGSEGSSKSLKIFVARPQEEIVWTQVEDKKLKGLKAGFYDFLIVDTSRKECARQLTIEIRSK
jgi:hypothetical protein